MGQVGSVLFEARNEKGLDISQVALDTNIEKIYIEALENDDYKKLPAEAYVVGFLRNYSEYLGLDANEIIRQYKNIKIETTEVPQEILLPKKNSSVMKIVLLVSSACFIVLLMYLSLMLFFSYRKNDSNTGDLSGQLEKLPIGRKIQEYEISQDTPLEKEVFKGDKIKANIEGEDYFITVLSTYPTLKLDIAGQGERLIETSETKSFDLNDDAIMDIEITVNALAENENDGLSVFIASGSDIGRENLGDVVASDIVSTEEKQKKSGVYKTFFTGTQAYPVILNAEFSGYCLFRVDLDKKSRIEQFYQKGARVENLKAQNSFRVWASNGFAVKCVLIGGGISKDLGVIGRPGEVIVKDFKWVKNDKTGEFYFVEMDVD